MQKKMLDFLCIAGVPGGWNVISPAPGKTLSLPDEDHHLHLQPTPRKKILTPGFWKSPTDSSTLTNSGLLHYWETGLFLLKPGKTTPMFQRGADVPKPSKV